MEIHIQTSDHVVAMEKVAEQFIAIKCSICNSVQVITDWTLTEGTEK